eukprot:s286_g21.t1
MTNKGRFWRCPWCRQDCKLTSNNCSGCGTAWHSGVEVIQHPPRGQPKSPRQSPRQVQADRTYRGGWDYSGYGAPQRDHWQSNAQRPKSPRRQPTKSPARQPPAARGPKQPQPKRRRSAKRSSLPDPEPEWDMQVTDNEDETTEAPCSASSTAEEKLSRLITKLQKSNNLDEDVQEALKEATAVSAEESSRKMQGAVSRLQNARDHLAQARKARANLHKSWAKVISDAVQRWNQHSEKFAAEDGKLEEAIQIAMEKFQKAKEDVENSKEALDAHNEGSKVPEVHEVSDEELMTDTTPQIAADIQTMVASFKKIKARQNESLDESTAKKAKTTDDGSAPSEFGQDHYVRKWTHRIFKDPTFCSEWHAIERAHEFHHQVTHDLCSTHWGGTPCSDEAAEKLVCMRSSSRRRRRSLRFSSQVLLYSGIGPHVQVEADALHGEGDFDVEEGINSPFNPVSHAADGDGTDRPVSSSTFVPFDPVVPPARDGAIYDMRNTWLLELRSAWREHAAEEHPGGGRVLQVQTWYLHHQAQMRCTRPRSVALDYMDHHWLNDIREVWQDQLRTGEPLHLAFVGPTPPSDDRHQYVAHVILSQGLTMDRFGIVFTARFLETHRTQLVQEAISSPTWISGRMAIDLMQLGHVILHRRWVARTGIQMFAADELEPLTDGLSVNIDVQVPPLVPDDATSLAAWHQQILPAQPAVTMMPHAVQQDVEDPAPEADDWSDDGDLSESGSSADEDWRFCHLFLLGKRIFHGMLPWKNPHVIRPRTAEIIDAPEDDIVILHYVKFGPSDLVAAKIQPLIVQLYDDLAIGSVHRMVLLDVEFHEHLPSTDVSASRRCATLPHITSRRALLSFVGLGTYCERVRQRCLIWHNHELLPLQALRPISIEHGDYIRIAVPPWPQAPAELSTRVCVSRVRQRPARLSYAPVRDPQPGHEDGMSVIDSYIRDHRALHARYRDEDDTLLLQVSSFQPEGQPLTSQVLASEIVAHFDVCPSDKLEDEHPTRMRQYQDTATRLNQQIPLIQDQQQLIQDLHALADQERIQRQGEEPRPLTVETWFSDPQRRPHSGMGRVVYLSEDFTSWINSIIFAWEDWIDPFTTLTCHLVQPHPEGSDPEVDAHVILVQHEHPQQASILVSIQDTRNDPWHPRLMCFSVPRILSHRALSDFADVERRCQVPGNECQTWFQDQELTELPQFDVRHGAALFFAIHQRDARHSPPLLDGDDGADDEGVQLLQTSAVSKRRLHLADSLPDPVWTHIDCQRPLYVRNQLWQCASLQPMLDTDQVSWHPATVAALQGLPPWTQEIPHGYTFYTDGSASLARGLAASAVVLLVHTNAGLRWGGYATCPCLGQATAPRAEATAFLLTARWLLNLLKQPMAVLPWVELAYDCDPVAQAAQGKRQISNNTDLLLVMRALIHWLEPQFRSSFHWRHLHSHQAHPWNEAADTLCRQALQSQQFTEDVVDFYNQCMFDGSDHVAVQWLWLLEQSLMGHLNAPPLVDGHWKLNLAAPLTQVRLMPHLFFSARAEALAAQFHEAGLHIVGLQETRSKLVGHARLQDFHVLSAAATSRGVGGVQLWIRRQICTGPINLKVEDTHLYILHATSHRLLVRWSTDGFKALLLVLHAPCVDDDITLEAFWRATTASIPSAYRSWRLLVLADSNSRLGSVQSDAVGPHQAEEENLKGSLFHQWLLGHSLCVPQTWEQHHFGQGATWSHSTGSSARLDYIAIPAELRDATTTTWVDESIDISIQRDDHAVVRMNVQIPFYLCPRPKRPHSCTASSWTSTPTWSMDVHSHAAALQGWLRACQRPRPHFRKAHLSDATRQLIQAKRHHRQRLLQVQRHRRHALMRQLFACWRSGHEVRADFRAWLRLCDRQAAQHLHAYQDLAPRVVVSVRSDDRAFYEQLAEDAGHASLRGSRYLWAALKHALPKWRSKARSNLRCSGPSTADKIDHYNQLEAGRAVTYATLLDNCCLKQRLAMSEAPLTLDLCQLPSRCEIESRLATCKPNKAPGLDLVSPETLSTHGLAGSDDVTKLMFKIWLTGAEPLQFKGGLIHTISKKHRSSQIADMRGIALLDGLGKIYHAVLRARMLPVLQSMRAPLQIGGFVHQSTLFATVYLRSFMQYANEQKMSASVVFLDLKSAFHSLVREVAFDMTATLPPRLHDLLVAAGCDVDALLHRCALPDKMPGLAPVTARLLADAHDHTWYTVASTDEVNQTHRGSRPGSPLADAAFNVLMTQVLREIHVVLADHPPLQAAFAQFGMPAHLVAWIDDVAVPVLASHASALVANTVWVLHQVIAICTTYGLTVNLKPTKTEAVLAFHGEGAPQCRHACFLENQGVLAELSDGQRFRCTPSYEHLGTLFVADGSIQAELEHRMAKAKQAYYQVSKPVLKNRHLSSKVRLNLLEGLIVPILTHGAGNWPLLTARQLTKISALYIKWVRSIVNNGSWSPDQMTDQHLLLQWSLPTIAVRLAKLRLLFAFHVVRDCPVAIVDMITAMPHNPHTWFAALRHALVWLREMDPDLIPWDPATASASHIWDWLRDHVDDGPRIVRRSFRRALLQGHVIARSLTSHQALLRCFLREDQVDSSSTSAAPSRAEALRPCQGRHECRLCAQHFDSLTQLHTHQWTAHEMISDERAMMTSTTCAACHQCFWTAQRLQQHLRYSRKHRGGCYERLTWRAAPHVTAPALDDVSDAPLFHRQPALLVPFVPSRIETLWDSRAVVDRVWLDHWHGIGMDDHPDQPHHDRLKEAFDLVLRRWCPSSTSTVDDVQFQLLTLAEPDGPNPSDRQGEWALCAWIFELRRSRFLHLGVEHFARLDHTLREFLRTSEVGRLLCWKWRMDDAYQPALLDAEAAVHERGASDLEPFVFPCLLQRTWLRPLFSQVFSCTTKQGVPMCFDGHKPILLILHMFSGRRRIGDCHWWLQHIGHRLLPGYDIGIVSVDTAIDKEKGDLSTGRNLELILRMASCGAFAASLTGPPCETFSAARGLQLEDAAQAGPRPLRSAEFPWCLQRCTPKELRQCATGSELLMNSFQVEATVVHSGGGAVMEHPWEAADPDKVSVWRLQCHEHWMMRLPDAFRHRVDQWVYGAVGVKPTCLRAANLGNPGIMERALTEGAELWRVRPTQGLKGKGPDGQYRTSRAKEYPSALCRSLIVSVLEGLRQRISCEGTQEPAQLTATELSWLRHMRAQSEVLASHSFLPDYQGA